MNKIKPITVSIIFILLVMLAPLFNQELNQSEETDGVSFAIGKVMTIMSEEQNKLLEETLGVGQTTQLVKVKILDGKYKGKVVETQNQLTSNPAYDIKVKPGDRVVLDIEKIGTDKINVYISDVERMPALMIIAGLFFTLILVIGGIKGLRALIALGITSFLVFFILVPAILNNLPIIPTTIMVVLVATFSTMFIISGISLKSISASIGTVGGLTIAGLISALIIKLAPLSGLTDQESIILWTSRPDLNLTGILTSAMIIGALGAIMDVGISIASSIEELKVANPSLTPSKLMRHGLNIGNDVMGAMANTLILAYIGGAFPLILLAANVPVVKFINLNSIASEITAALAGSIGIILCVPITAAISSYLYSNNQLFTTNISTKNSQQ